MYLDGFASSAPLGGSQSIGSPPLGLRTIAGFESTQYRYHGERIVWAGTQALTDHPRNFHQPWSPPKRDYHFHRLQTGAQICQGLLVQGLLPKHSLLLWWLGEPLPFPLNHAQNRFDALKLALQQSNLNAFEQACLRVLGLGSGLTPSGDDCLNGIFLVLALVEQHPLRQKWQAALSTASPATLPALCECLQVAAQSATHTISAALLADAMQGQSYRALHEVLDAMHSADTDQIAHTAQQLLRLGASSGADLLTGLLLILTLTTPQP